MSIAEKQIDLDVAGSNILVGNGVRFERIRRITGYLVGTLDRFNNAKRAEVEDRVKHLSFQKWQKDHRI